MELTFIGQQSWLIEENDTAIIVDPLLTETFGTSKEIQFRVYPARTIDFDKLPTLSAIFITNEHLDHFHIQSLKILDKSIPVYVGQMMPECVRNVITDLGFKLNILANSELVVIKDLRARFYIGHHDVPFWEKRVYQLYVTNKSDFGVFIQSDTIVNDFFVSQVDNKIEVCPKVFISTNNAQILPLDLYGAFDNLLPIYNSSKDGLVGISILEEVLVNYPAKLPDISYLLLSGGGYIIDKENSKPFLFSDIDKINAYLSELSLGMGVNILSPGEKINFIADNIFIDQVNWIKLDEKINNKFKCNSLHSNQNPDFTLKEPIFNEFSDENFINQNMDLINSELQELAKLIILSDFGRDLLSVNTYLEGNLNAERFVINFKIDNKNSLIYSLNINSSSFNKVELNPGELLNKYPYGIEVFIGDFIALLHGRIQIWELATANMRQWYLGDKINSPIAFLYCFYSEQIRPELASKVYRNITNA